MDPETALKQNLKLEKEFIMCLQDQQMQGIVGGLNQAPSSNTDTLKNIQIALTPSGLKATIRNQSCCE